MAAQPADAVAILSSYPKNPALDKVIASLDEKPKAPGDTGWVLQRLYFKSGDPMQIVKCCINEKGQAYIWTSKDALASAMPVTGVTQASLTGGQMRALQNSLKGLPPNVRPANPENLLLLHYRDDATWTTRIYDRTQLPVAVRAVISFVPMPEVIRFTRSTIPRMATGEPQFDITLLYQKVSEVVRRHYPAATVTSHGDRIHFESKVQSFVTHPSNATSAAQQGRAELGPRPGGIYGDITIARGQAPVYNDDTEYKSNEQAFKRVRTVSHAVGSDTHAIGHIKYPNDVPEGFLEELQAVIASFQQYVTPRTQ